MIYWVALLIMAIIGHNRGHKPWKSSVRQANFVGASEGGAPAAQTGPRDSTTAAQPIMQQQEQSSAQDPAPNALGQGYSATPDHQGPYQVPHSSSPVRPQGEGIV
jgi:hypothetical protein